MDAIKAEIDRYLLAYHEAGHVVVGAALGAPPSFATIEQKGTMGGHTETRPERGQLNVWDRPIDALAGYVAQIRYAPESIESAKIGASTDFDRAEWCVRRWFAHTPDEESLDHARKDAREKTEALVDQHWATIERVAEALVEKEQLKEREIDALLDAHLILEL